MSNIIDFTKENQNFDRMEWLAEQISDYGFDVSIIRNEHNWAGELAFTPAKQISEKAIPLMEEMKQRWDADQVLRELMYGYYFSVGALYYEAGTSRTLSFHEVRMPNFGGAQ